MTSAAEKCPCTPLLFTWGHWYYACRNAGQGFMKSQFDIFDQDGPGERFNTEALK